MLRRISLVCLLAFLLSACQASIPKDALLLSPESLADRQMQTRRFDTNNNQAMLSAAGAVLQDLGFTLDESETTLGILVASKRRDATSGAQIAGAVLIALLGGGSKPVDKEQLIRVAMVMREIAPSTPEEPKKATPAKSAKAQAEEKAPGQSTVRVTFQRVIINTANQVTLAEQINEPEIYQEFFDKLSQSVFLEAHNI
ncbi:MAG: hypothetical protein FWD30_04070 [Dehalococcoidia bacterium]|nr:hypothetical protein [Dehalococcoidia bacterium]